MGLVRTPELFGAAASYAGVTSLPMLISDWQWYMLSDLNTPTIGGEWGDGARLERNSPLHNVKSIRAPVLLAHGQDDSIVSVKQSKIMADALRDAVKEVEYLEFDDEIHGFLLERNELQFYERLGAFFEKNLAPRQKPSVN